MKEINNNISGLLLINKPINYSSYDCIRYIKKILNYKTKIGHAGTLDNFATGLLIIAIGREFTKKINLFLNSDKEYLATGKIGELTDTLDNTGNIKKTSSKNITSKQFEDVIKNFPKNYIQIPPIYSALKFKGTSLYKITRKKELSNDEIEKITKSKERTVNIFKLKLINYNYPFFTIKSKVSKGTYIRSLINDIAKQFDSFATCHSLTRTAIGKIKLTNSVDLFKIKNIKDIKNNIIITEKLIKNLL